MTSQPTLRDLATAAMRPHAPAVVDIPAWQEMTADSRLAELTGEFFTDTIAAADYPGTAEEYAYLVALDAWLKQHRDQARRNPPPAQLTGESGPPRSNVPSWCRLPNGAPRGLDDLDDNPAVDIAVDWVSRFMSDTEKPAKGLLFGGLVGRGKTSIAAAMAVDCGEPNNAAFWSTQDLLTAAKRDMLADQETGVTLRRAQTKPLLVLDELGRERRSDFNVDAIRELLEARYNRRLPVIITTNLTNDELADHVGPRLWSRLAEMVDIVAVTGPDRRLRSAS